MSTGRSNDKGQELCGSCGKPLSSYWTTKCLHCNAPFEAGRRMPQPHPDTPARPTWVTAGLLVALLFVVFGVSMCLMAMAEYG